MRKVIIKQRRRTLGDLYKFRKLFEKFCERQRMQNSLITTFDILVRNEISQYQATQNQQ